jgi:hypothetical protein
MKDTRINVSLFFEGAKVRKSNWKEKSVFKKMRIKAEVMINYE